MTMLSEEAVERGLSFFREAHPKGAAELEAKLGAISPDLMGYAASFAFGEVYQRPGLETRERQIATLAALAALGAQAQLKTHVGLARGLGLSADEIMEICIQIAPYVGFPAAINAAATAAQALAETDAAAAE